MKYTRRLRESWLAVSLAGICCLMGGSLSMVSGAPVSEPEGIDETFTSDLYVPTIGIGESLVPWEINQERVAKAGVSGKAMVDTQTLLEGKPTLKLRPTESNLSAAVSWTVPVEEGRFYRFAAAMRSAARHPDDKPSTLPLTGKIRLNWLDVKGNWILTRDRLESHGTSESYWVRHEAVGLVPPGATQAKLILECSCYELKEDSAIWVGDMRWGPVHVAPLEVNVTPRLLLHKGEPVTIDVRRSHRVGVTSDGNLTIELADSAGNVHRQWNMGGMVTLPWTTRIVLPEDIPEVSQWNVNVTITPIKEYPGAVIWKWSETIYAALDSGNSRLRGGRFFIQGKKRFLISVYHALEKDFSILKEAGFNTVQFKSYNAEEALKILDELQGHGLFGVGNVGGGSAPTASLRRVEGVVKALKDHPFLAMWLLQDEPTRHGIGPKEIAWFAHWLKSIAPGIPACLNDTGPYQFHRYATAVDVFSVDPYPIQGKYKTEDPQMVGRWLNYVAQLVPKNRAFLGVVGVYKSSKGNMPTALEMRSMVYQVVCSGAAGVMYYSLREGNWYLPDEPLFAEIKRMNAELAELEPWLVTLPLAPEACPVKFRSKTPDRLMSATWSKDGRHMTILINQDNAEQTVKCEQKSTGRPLKMKDGRQFPGKLTLQPLEVLKLEYSDEGWLDWLISKIYR